MKAITFHKYGSPKVLKMNELEKPSPAEDEVLIKMHAAAVNPIDWHTMRADPFLSRLGNGLFKPKFHILGADISGVVEAVGSKSTEFKVGDHVFGEITHGGFTEYICVKEEKIAFKPKNLSFQEAASVGVVGYTAIQGLRDKGGIKPGQKVLINGASGGVGTFAVQYAKSVGAEVTGVCSTRNLELVKSIGADYVVDYTKEDFTKASKKYDLVYDAVGNLSLSAAKRALTPDGKCIVAGITTLSRLFSILLFSGWATRHTNKSIEFMGMANPNKKDLLYIKELLESEKVKPVIDQCFPFEETAKAIGYLETGRARGKVIVQIAS